MNRRVWTGILAGVLSATVLLGVAGAAYRAGQRSEVVTRVVGDGEVVRVVGGHGWGYGPGGGFLLFPLLLTVLVVFLLVRAFRGGGWGGGHGDWFEERHRRAHAGSTERADA
ncbi:MAG TPA: hypothetical protein VHF27_14365 [Acidimicrobiales bacterium]|nr:hypothetical protein [Acidimicrobiales bacterium]